MDGLLKRIQRVRPATFCSRDFFLLQDNVSAHKTASVCQFLTQKKCCNPLSPPALFRFISARLFSVPQLENEVKRTPLCRCCWGPRSRKWWIKESPKRGIFGSCSEIVRSRKRLYIYASGAYFELKKVCVFELKKKNQSLNFWAALCISPLHKVYRTHITYYSSKINFNIIFPYILFHTRRRFLLAYEPRVA